jgi:hypothetical protein
MSFYDDSNINQFASLAMGTLGLGGKPGYLHHSSLRCPSPFFSTADLYNPKTVKELFHYCRYYYKTSPVVNPLVRVLARYPITEILVQETDPDIKNYWDHYLNYQLKLRSFDIEIGLDYFVYGNAFPMLSFPIQKILECPNCKKEYRIQDAQYRFRSMQYELTCKFCGVMNVAASVKDYEKKSEKEIKLIRLNPELIDIEVNPITGQSDYFYTLPRYLRNEIVMGKRHIIETLPDIYIESIRKQRRIRLSDGKFFHFKRPSISEQESTGWGEPIITPVMKTAYYVQILRKAQEAIMHSSIVPLRFVFPQPGDSQSNASPYNAVNLLRWTNTIRTELVKWRRDPNHVGIVPLPVGHQVVGADGKAMTLFNEVEICFNEMCNGMGLPLELLKGGLSWSGSNMSLRLLQNDFYNYRIEMQNFNQEFVLGNICSFLGKNRPNIEWSKFKMADDLQRSALENQLFQQQVLSASTLLDGMDHNYSNEKQKIKLEQQDLTLMNKKNQLTQANIAGQASLIQAKYQARAQKDMMAMQAVPQNSSQEHKDPTQAMQSPLQDEAPGMPVQDIAKQYNSELEKMAPQDKSNTLQQIKGSAPEVYAELMKLQVEQQGSKFDSLNDPMSQVKPPRNPTPVM